MTSFYKKSTFASRGTFLVVTLLCLALFTGFRTGNPASSSDRAFRGFYEGYVSVPVGVPEQYITFTVTGNATHLGKFEMAAAGNLNLSTLQLTGGTATFTGAHGDQLYTEYSSSGQPIGDGTYWVTAEHTIINGTGRFEGATGSISTTSIARMMTTLETVTITGKVRMQGTISY